jgi:3-hydroxybutyryl-CoA dehydrogenase
VIVRGAPVAVVGAGTMGGGIAQVAAVAGHPVVVYAVEGDAARAAGAIRDRVAGLVAKGRLSLDPVGPRLLVAAELGDLAGARCVIEAVAEDLAVKQALFADLEKVVAPDCVLATNTSSLSPTAIAAGLTHPGRLVGMHFFNPAPVMRLVEVVSGLATDPAVAAAVTRLAQDWGKQVVQASATPGFIVNRVARPFYAEALRLAEEQAASPATIDAVLTGAGGFRMGPFALMDLVGRPGGVHDRRRPGPGRDPDRRHDRQRGCRRAAQGSGQRRRHRHRHAARHQLPDRSARLGRPLGPGHGPGRARRAARLVRRGPVMITAA